MKEILTECGDRLIEHYDSVLIVATLDNANVTDAQTIVRGNTFASEGAARAWLSQRQTERKIAIEKDEE